MNTIVWLSFFLTQQDSPRDGLVRDLTRQIVELAKVTDAAQKADVLSRSVDVLAERALRSEGQAAQSLTEHAYAIVERGVNPHLRDIQDEEKQRELRARTGRQIEALKKVLEKVPEPARDSIRNAIEKAQRGLDRAAERRKAPERDRDDRQDEEEDRRDRERDRQERRSERQDERRGPPWKRE